MSVDEHTIELGSAPIFYRSAAPPPAVATGSGAMGSAPLFLHDIPMSSDDWVPVLERTGGIAPDLIGFGRSAKWVDLDYSVPGLADFAEDLTTALGVDGSTIVGHGWGAAVALELARRRPDAIRRLVLIDPLALVDGFNWSPLARAWRIRLIGELTMGFTQRWMLARALQRASTTDWPDQRIPTIWKQFDQGTQRAILRLHRSIDEQPAAPVALSDQALLIWGEQDPWFPVALADAYRAQIPGAQLERVAGAGHWPWLDRPELIERIATFL